MKNKEEYNKMAKHRNEIVDVNERLHQTGYNNQGDLMEIIEYRNSMDITVRFLDKYNYTKKTSYKQFTAGSIKNPYHVFMGHNGYLGEGYYKSAYKINDKIVKDPAYFAWVAIHRRAGDFAGERPTYIDVEVDETWWNYQNFAKWYHKNIYKIEGEHVCIDKDILYPGNNVYGPDTCIIIPDRFNQIFKKELFETLKNGLKPRSDTNKEVYRVQYKEKVDGLYEKFSEKFYNHDEAFEFYKEKKLKLIRDLAEDYRDKVPERIYNIFANYTFDNI